MLVFKHEVYLIITKIIIFSLVVLQDIEHTTQIILTCAQVIVFLAWLYLINLVINVLALAIERLAIGQGLVRYRLQ